MAQRLRSIALPLALLAAVSVLSLGARIAWLGQPCHSPCRSSTDHLLVFDEAYYVNAARVIAGIAPPANENYATASLGDDPNAEHPQLMKLMIAGSIELFGDGPLAWRLASIVFGSLAILGMFALVRAAGGSDWLGVVAAALMAFDNLLLVHGRIGTLDVPVLATMIWAAVLYLRGRPLAAGALIGVGSCIKLVAPYTVLVLVLFELVRIVGRGRGRAMRSLWSSPAARLGACTATAAGVFVGLLAILDRIAPPYDPVTNKLLAAGPFHHIAHMLSYAAHQSSPHGPKGIASYPWTWLVDYKPIDYLTINPAHPTASLFDIHPAVHFIGMISPPIMLLAVPSLVIVGWGFVVRRRPPARSVSAPFLDDPGSRRDTREARPEGDIAIVGLAWFLGTFVPFVLLSVLYSRTSYLYYMIVVMPGIYLTVTYVLYRARRYRKLIVLWAGTVLAAAIVMYPLTPIPLP